MSRFALLAVLALVPCVWGFSIETETVERTNLYRSWAGLNPVTWSSTIASQASAWAAVNAAEGCRMAHSDKGTGYRPAEGENIYQSSTSGGPFETAGQISGQAKAAVNAWYDEIKWYTLGPVGSETKRNEDSYFNFGNPAYGVQQAQIGHFTQLLWEDTTEIGCGYDTCTKSNGWNSIIVVCQYSPAGNWLGQYPFTQTNADQLDSNDKALNNHLSNSAYGNYGLSGGPPAETTAPTTAPTEAPIVTVPTGGDGICSNTKYPYEPCFRGSSWSPVVDCSKFQWYFGAGTFHCPTAGSPQNSVNGWCDMTDPDCVTIS